MAETASEWAAEAVVARTLVITQESGIVTSVILGLTEIGKTEDVVTAITTIPAREMSVIETGICGLLTPAAERGREAERVVSVTETIATVAVITKG